jgi:NAD(P)-dependent dehydrogenase (short-subunit alcohol dehydrogenase family)
VAHAESGQPAAWYSRVPGYKVVAVYHGNDQVAERFKRDTGIPVVTVNAICPGYIATGMVRAMPVEVVEKKILPLILVGRLCEAEEVARAVRLFLASDDAGFIAGSTMTVNGGQYMP